jgi:hypothetical protein
MQCCKYIDLCLIFKVFYKRLSLFIHNNNNNNNNNNIMMDENYNVKK